MTTVRSSRFPFRVELRVEELEARELLAAPTAVEQLFLERLNDARANPAAYGAAIGVDLSNVAASQPLAFDSQLIDAALGHSQDMSANNYFGHYTQAGVDPGGRIAAAGFAANGWGESIAAGYSTPDEALAGLITDAGVPDLGHRIHLLDMTPQFDNEHLVGVGIVQNGSGAYHNYYTIDSAGTFDNRVYLTGSAFNDANRNGRYDLGEGLGNITITVAGVGSVQTYASGGYQIALKPGTYTVTASGAGLGTFTQTITIGSSNVRLNFTQFGVAGAASPVAPSSAVTTNAGTGASGTQIFVTGSGPGAAPVVNVYDARSGALKASFMGLPATFTGGVRVAVGDVNGDGVEDIIVGAGPGGGPQVTVYDGTTFQIMRSYMALPASFTGGVFVASGDVNGDGYDDIITSADAGGGPQVTVQSGRDGSLLASFYATVPTFTGGIRVASGDLNGDGYDDVIAVAGPGGGPQVTIFDGRTLSVLRAFFAVTPSFSGGLYVAVGDVNGDGRADIVTGAEKGGGPQVSVFNGPDLAQIASFFALPSNFTGGVRVAVVDRNGDGRAEVLTAAGAGGGPQVATFDSLTWQATSNFYAYNSSFTGGLYLGGR